jgi:hypothetical protein
MAGFEDIAEVLVATAAQIARLQKAEPAATVLEKSSASLLETGSAKNWGESISLYTLMLQVPITTYAMIEDQRDGLENVILDRVAPLVRIDPRKRITQVVIGLILGEESRPVEPGPEETGTQEQAPSFWQQGFFRLFISHTSAHKHLAHRLRAVLTDYKVAAFVAHHDIEPSREWEAEIELALRTMDAMSAIVTPDFPENPWCDQEVGFAIRRGKLVVPLCQDAIPHGFLGKYQGFKAKGLIPASVAEQLADILVAHPLSAERMTDALVERIATSRNWDMSKRTMNLLEKAARLNSPQVARLMQSLDANFQVSSAPQVAVRIRSLVSRIGEGQHV